jgi:hypothetical protein
VASPLFCFSLLRSGEAQPRRIDSVRDQSGKHGLAARSVPVYMDLKSALAVRIPYTVAAIPGRGLDLRSAARPRCRISPRVIGINR